MIRASPAVRPRFIRPNLRPRVLPGLDWGDAAVIFLIVNVFIQRMPGNYPGHPSDDEDYWGLTAASSQSNHSNNAQVPPGMIFLGIPWMVPGHGLYEKAVQGQKKCQSTGQQPVAKCSRLPGDQPLVNRPPTAHRFPGSRTCLVCSRT